MRRGDAGWRGAQARSRGRGTKGHQGLPGTGSGEGAPPRRPLDLGLQLRMARVHSRGSEAARDVDTEGATASNGHRGRSPRGSRWRGFRGGGRPRGLSDVWAGSARAEAGP